MKTSFILYGDYEKHFELLDDAGKSELIMAIFAFARGEDLFSSLSPVVKMAFSFIKDDLIKNAEAYEQAKNAKSEAGKKGMESRWGKKETSSNDSESETSDNKDNSVIGVITNDNTNIASDNKDNLYVNVDVNDNVDVNKLVNNKNNNIFDCYNNAGACVRVRERSNSERKSLIALFKEFFDWCYGDHWKESAYEIIDTALEANEQCLTKQGLIFNKQTYKGNDFCKLIQSVSIDSFRNIVAQITLKKDIVNRPVYILGCLIKASRQELKEMTQEEFEALTKEQGTTK